MTTRGVRIGGKKVSLGEPTFIVAEIGINHNGDVDLAKKMIDVAVEAGADAVKFQKRTVPVVFSQAELDKPREVPRILLEHAIRRGVLPRASIKRLKTSKYKDTRNGDQKYALELNKREYKEIDRYCKEKGILWFASPWDEESVDFLEAFKPPAYKVASASLTDDGLLKHIRSKGRPVILSTGAATLPMIKRAVAILGKKNLVILQCTAAYPKIESVQSLAALNLECIPTLQKNFPGVPVGFSGNDSGSVMTFAATVLGAVMIEKHLTLERGMWGSDQASSIEPPNFKTLCHWIRDYRHALGDGIKKISVEEEEVMKKLRRK